MFRENDLGFLIKLIHDDVGRYCTRTLRDSGLTRNQLETLDWLVARKEEGRVTCMQDVAEYLGVRQPTASGIIRRMEERGLVQRSPHPQDKRAWQIDPITPRTRDALGVAQLEAMLTQGLTPQEIASVVDLLKKVYANIENALAEGDGAEK